MEVWKILGQDNDKKSKQYNINITFAQILSFNKKEGYTALESFRYIMNLLPLAKLRVNHIYIRHVYMRNMYATCSSLYAQIKSTRLSDGK